MPAKIAFIINPKAGAKRKIDLKTFITTHFSYGIPFDIITWQHKNDFASIQQTILTNRYTAVVACGGDGTVNQVASVVMNTPMALGILPLGSGNGLARSHRISMNLKQALHTIAVGRTTKIDVGRMNSKPFFCTAGIGFDALIAYQFANSTKRGFTTYIQKALKEYVSYAPKQYAISIDGKHRVVKAFLMTVANAGQWGNNVYIAPEAKLNDGLFHVSLLNPFSMASLPTIGLKLFTKKIHTFNKLETFTGKEIKIEFDGVLPAHFDGEPMMVEHQVNITLEPLALSIIC